VLNAQDLGPDWPGWQIIVVGNGIIYYNNNVPLPGAVWLLGSGLGLLAGRRFFAKTPRLTANFFDLPIQAGPGMALPFLWSRPPCLPPCFSAGANLGVRPQVKRTRGCSPTEREPFLFL